MEKGYVPLLLLLAAAVVTAAGKNPYSLGSHTRLGYSANANLFDAANNRIYSSSRDGVYAVDSGRRKVIGLLAHLPVGALAFDASKGELFILARNEDRLRVLDVNTRKVIRTFDAPAAHNVVFEPSRGELYYLRGDETSVRVVERERGETITTIQLEGHPSFVMADPARRRILVRLFDRDLIQVLDATERRVTVSWPLRANGISAMTVDAVSGRVFVSSGKDVKMLDGLSGKELGRFSAGDQVVAIAYDPATKLVAALWGSRMINIARVDLMEMTPVQTIDLRTPARQLFIDPRTHTLFAMGLVTDDKGFGRSSSPDTTGNPRISALLTLHYKGDDARLPF